ncbi:MAG: DMT family transporter [Gammaproteobacteria bacterium]|nr:DMT family transporter [Gammaproteobacteria bacterium]
MHGAAGHNPQNPGAAWTRWLLLGILVAMWGSAFGLITVALRELPAVSLAGFRLLTGWLILLPVAWFRGTRFKSEPRVWGYFALIAVMGNCLPFYLIAWGQQSVPSGAAGILMSVTPLVVVVLAHFFLPGERASLRKVLGVLAGFIGIWLLMAPSLDSGLLDAPGLRWRQLGILTGAMCYGLTIVIARRHPLQDPLQAATAVLGISAALMLGPALVAMPSGPWGHWNEQTLLSMLLLGPLCTGYATVVYFQLVRATGATFLSLINYLIPVWAMLAGAIFLGERLHWSAWLAMLVVLTGVTLAGRRGKGAS